MLIWKNDNTDRAVAITFPKSFVVAPDETVKATAMLYDRGMSLVGYESTSYLDFEQPFVKSYTVDISNNGVVAVFDVTSLMTIQEYSHSEVLSIVLTDSSGNLITAPNTNIKVFVNMLSAVDTSSAPFSYLFSNMLEFNKIKR